MAKTPKWINASKRKPPKAGLTKVRSVDFMRPSGPGAPKSSRGSKHTVDETTGKWHRMGHKRGARFSEDRLVNVSRGAAVVPPHKRGKKTFKKTKNRK